MVGFKTDLSLRTALLEAETSFNEFKLILVLISLVDNTEVQIEEYRLYQNIENAGCLKIFRIILDFPVRTFGGKCTLDSDVCI